MGTVLDCNVVEGSDKLLQFTVDLGFEQRNIFSGIRQFYAEPKQLVGRKVIVPTEKAVVDTSETFKGSLVLPVTSSNVYVNVYDSAGKAVSRVNLGQQAAGNVSFMWDGKDSSGNLLPPGTYKFEAQATYADGTKGLYTLLPANVDSVALGQNGGEMKLNLAGIGSVPLSQVQIIGQ